MVLRAATKDPCGPAARSRRRAAVRHPTSTIPQYNRSSGGNVAVSVTGPSVFLSAQFSRQKCEPELVILLAPGPRFDLFTGVVTVRVHFRCGAGNKWTLL